MKILLRAFPKAWQKVFSKRTASPPNDYVCSSILPTVKPFLPKGKSLNFFNYLMNRAQVNQQKQ